MELFRTVIEPSALFDRDLDWSSQLFFVGSCFAQGMADTLSPRGFNCYTNPYGTIYNPFSTAGLLQNCLSKKTWTKKDLFQHETQSYSLHHHGSIKPDVAKLNAIEQQSLKQLKKSKLLIITHGTAWTYQLKSSQEPISNCHRLPAHLFERRLSTPEELFQQWAPLIPQLLAINPQLKICFTVSPVRHLRDDFRENQLSKSVLQLFTENICSQFNNCEYFPSYELMMDDLRDYRFYEADMCHPNKTAINYIAEKFFQSAFTPEINSYLKVAKKISTLQSHRASCPEQKKILDQKVKQLIQQAQQNFPDCFPGFNHEV